MNNRIGSWWVMYVRMVISGENLRRWSYYPGNSLLWFVAVDMMGGGVWREKWWKGMRCERFGFGYCGQMGFLYGYEESGI